MKLLIVDDSGMIRRSIERVVQQFSFHEIQTASNGLIALEIFKSMRPEVVTLDITMPGTDGLTVLESIKKIAPETRVLIVSALADNATAIQCLKMGASSFLCKPFTSAELAETLTDIIV